MNGKKIFEKIESVNKIIDESISWDSFIPIDENKEQFFNEMAEIYPKYNQDYNIKKGMRFNLISRKNYTHVIYKRLKYKEFMDSSMCIILKNHYFLYTCFAR